MLCNHCVMYAMHWQGSSEVKLVMGWSKGGGLVEGFVVGGRSALRKDPQLGKPENPPHWLQVTNAIYGTVLSANILLGMTT